MHRKHSKFIKLQKRTYAGHESLINVLLAHIRLKLGRLQEAQEKLIDHLQMRPARLIRGLVLLLINLVGGFLADGGQYAKNVVRHHGDNLRVDRLTQAALGHTYIVNELVQAGSLHFLALEIGHRVHEVEDNAALLQLLNEQLLLLLNWRVLYGGQRL